MLPLKLGEFSLLFLHLRPKLFELPAFLLLYVLVFVGFLFFAELSASGDTAFPNARRVAARIYPSSKGNLTK